MGLDFKNDDRVSTVACLLILSGWTIIFLLNNNKSISSSIPWTFRCFSWKEMTRFTCTDKAIAFSLFVYGTPNLAQLVNCLSTLDFFMGKLSFVSFTSTSWSLPDSRSYFFTVFFIFILHLTSWFIFQSG